MLLVREWRREGVECYFTIDAGPNVHLICEPRAKDEVLALLRESGIVEDLILNSPGEGAKLSEEHLF